MTPQGEYGHCELCGRWRPLSFHHYIPRRCHNNKWFRKNFTKDEMRTRGIRLCRDCHRFIHRHYGEKQLGRQFNTRQAMLKDETIIRFIQWVRKKR